MVTVNFTLFRQKARKYFDAVEKGETIQVKRHGKIVARILPPVARQPSWKRHISPLIIPGVSLSKTILQERRRSP